ncbi:ATP-binding protein [Streptomyces xanthochromogenes]|uniref:ATP-binding protein n=1 Tax=Streptomyces xanthochromogenes TaxID=67384 RepID=UPI0037F8D2BF
MKLHEQRTGGALASPGLRADLAQTVALRAAVCVTSAVPSDAARRVLTLAAQLGYPRPVAVDGLAAGTFTQVLDALYQALILDLRYGPRPREQAKAHRRIEKELQRRIRVVVIVTDAQALTLGALRYLATLEGWGGERVPLVLTGAPQLMASVDRAPALVRRLHAWHPLPR